MTKELVIVSGKGGTGKTSVVASFAMLARGPVLADCDVDAPDLHLLLSPRVLERHEFRCGHRAEIRTGDCAACGECLANCRFDAVRAPGSGTSDIAFSIDPVSCEGCGVCVRFCPENAIDFPDKVSGEWMISDSRGGPMVHARLGVASGNSGMLVSTVRQEARGIAEARGLPWVIVDGPPGIGCPVIASVAGASLALVVTEPSLSGEHDLERLLSLTRHFSVPTAVCVNRWDINRGMTERIEEAARRAGARIAGRIRYDRGMPRAQMQERTAVELDAPCAADIRRIWAALALETA